MLGATSLFSDTNKLSVFPSSTEHFMYIIAILTLHEENEFVNVHIRNRKLSVELQWSPKCFNSRELSHRLQYGASKYMHIDTSHMHINAEY